MVAWEEEEAVLLQQARLDGRNAALDLSTSQSRFKLMVLDPTPSQVRRKTECRAYRALSRRLLKPIPMIIHRIRTHSELAGVTHPVSS